MNKPAFRKLSFALIISSATLLVACNSGGSTNTQQQPNVTKLNGKKITSTNLQTSLTNQLTGFGKIGTPGYENTVPVICMQNADKSYSNNPLTGGETLNNLEQYSGNQYWAGAAIRAGGCDQNNNPYLGFIGFNLNGSQPVVFQSYSASGALHINFSNLNVDNSGNLTGTPSYTPIESDINDGSLKPTSVTRKLPYIGINLSGLEFSNVINTSTAPDLSQQDENQSQYTDLPNMQKFVQSGVNTVRVPVSWSFLALGGESDPTINLAYWSNFVQPLLETLTSAGIYTIFDLHSYMHYSWMGSQISGCIPSVSQCPDGTLDTNANDYVGIWTNIYSLIKADSNINQQYLMLDLMNEPAAASGENLTVEQVYNAEVPVAKALQSQGFNGKILLEGNNWTGLHSWTTLADSEGKTNADVFTNTNLKASGININNILINVHQYLDSDFSGTQNTCLPASALSSTGTNGFNLQAFTNYLQTNGLQAIVTETGAAVNGASSCQATLQGFLDYLNTNAANGAGAGFVGVTLWGAGHGWGGASSYNLYVDPTTYQFATLVNEDITN